MITLCVRVLYAPGPFTVGNACNALIMLVLYHRYSLQISNVPVPLEYRHS